MRLDCTSVRQPTEQVVQVLSDLVEVPRPRLEPVGRGGERADRADLHGVAAEVAGEGVVGERVDLRLVAAVLEVDERVAGHLVGEARAAVAEDAALAVEGHEVADHDRLLEVPLLLHEPALARAVGERLVLERALAALVAHGAVERVVDEEELEDAVLRLLGDLALGVDLHVGRDGDHAGGLEGGAAAGVDLDDAHPAHADRLHPRVVAEARDVGAVALGGLDHELAGLRLDLLAVDREEHGLGGGLACQTPATSTADSLRDPAPVVRRRPRTRRGSGGSPTRSATRPTGRGRRSSSSCTGTGRPPSRRLPSWPSGTAPARCCRTTSSSSSTSAGRPSPASSRAQDLLEPAGALAARRALAARLPRVEAHEPPAGPHHVGGGVHHHDRPGAEHRAARTDRRSGRAAGRRAPGRNHGAEPPPGMNALSSLPSRMPPQYTGA